MSDKVVVYAGTHNIYPQMYTALKSLIFNNDIDRVYLLVDDNDFPYPVPENVHLVNVSEQEFFKPGSPNYSSKWSYMAMLRCVFGFMFSEEHKMLWLDCDTIVDSDITDLFDMNMDGYFYAGVMEPQKCKGVFRYINTGVLLLNLDLLREHDKERELLEFLNKYKFNFPDQDVINMLCQGRIKTIDSEYNSTVYTTPCVRPRIIHYAAMSDYENDWAYQKYTSMNFVGKEDDEQ